MNENRRTPLVLLLLVFIALLFLNLDGYHKHIWSPWGPGGEGSHWLKTSIFDEVPNINWAHGWPCCFLMRCGDDVGAGQKYNIPAWQGDPPTSRWPIDLPPPYRFKAYPLIFDATFTLLILVAVYFSFRDWLILRFRFGLKSMFVTTALIAVFFAFRLWEKIPRHIPQFAALGLIALITLCILGRGIWALISYFYISRFRVND